MKPCGQFHPLPCGLDIDCEVPVEYFNGRKKNKEIWKKYVGAFE